MSKIPSGKNIFDFLPSLDSYAEELVPKSFRQTARKFVKHFEELDENPFEMTISNFNDSNFDEDKFLHDLVNCIAISRMAAPHCPIHNDSIRIEDGCQPDIIQFKLKFPIPCKEIEEQRIALKAIATEIAQQASNIESEFGKVSFFHEWLIDHVKYGDMPTNVADLKDQMFQRTAKGAFINGVATCEGFSRAMRMLCEAAGIYCLVLPIKAFLPELNQVYTELADEDDDVFEALTDSPNHALCFIVADGKPFYYDATLSPDIKTSFDDNPQNRQIGKAVSLKMIKALSQNEILFSDKLVPKETENDYTDPSQWGCYFGAYDINAIREHIILAGKQGLPRAFFVFDTPDHNHDLYKDLWNGESQANILEAVPDIVEIKPVVIDDFSLCWVDINRDFPLRYKDRFCAHDDVIAAAKRLEDDKEDDSDKWWLYRNQLGKEDKELYDTLVLSAADFYIFVRRNPNTDLFKIDMALELDEPAMRWRRFAEPGRSSDNIIVHWVFPSSDESDPYGLNKPISILRNAVEEMKRTASNETELVFLIYHYVCSQIKDKEKTKQVLSGDRLEQAQAFSFDAPMQGLTTECGLAKMFAVMCRLAQIECQIVSGPDDPEQYFWNIVKADNKFFNVICVSYGNNMIRHALIGLTDKDIELLGIKRDDCFVYPKCNCPEMQPWHGHELPSFELESVTKICIQDLEDKKPATYMHFDDIPDNYGCTKDELLSEISKLNPDLSEIKISNRSSWKNLGLYEILWKYPEKH